MVIPSERCASQGALRKVGHRSGSHWGFVWVWLALLLAPFAAYASTPAGASDGPLTLHPLRPEHLNVSRWTDTGRGPELACAGTLGASARALDIRLPLLTTRSTAKQRVGKMFQVIYQDPPEFGFFDPRPVAPLAGNPATTLGGQRRAVLEAALGIWASRLDSKIALRVAVRFEDMGCTGAAAAGPGGMVSNFPGAPRPNVFYPLGLASALSGRYFRDDAAELYMFFNTEVERPGGCFSFLPDGFWYGLDQYAAPSPAGFSFLEVTLHELGHALGISPWVDLDTGAWEAGGPDIYSQFVHSRSHQRDWPQLSAAERVQSIQPDNLVWTGPHTRAQLPSVLPPQAQVRAPTANDANRSFDATRHEFAPMLPPPGLTGVLQIARNGIDQPASAEGARQTNDACQSLQEMPALQEPFIVLATGAGCPYVDKWRHAYAAGASALLVAETRESAEPNSVANVGLALAQRMPIPLWVVGRSSGEALLAQTPSHVTLGFAAEGAPAGTFDGQLGLHISVSHMSTRTIPRLLMGVRSGSGGNFGYTDLADQVLYDLGWPDASGRPVQFAGSWFNPERSGEGCQLTLEGDDQTFILTCYLNMGGGQFWLLGNTTLQDEELNFGQMTITSGARYGDAFDPADVVREDWGSIRMSLVDCNTAVLDLWPRLPGYGRVQTRMRRIIGGDCQLGSASTPDRSRAGSYFDPARSGEGFQLSVEADGHTAVLSLYSYAEGRQLWALGNASLQADQVVIENAVITRGTGFGVDFDPTQVERIPFGRIEVRWLDCNDVQVRITPVLEGLVPSDRRMTRIVQRRCNGSGAATDG